MRNIRKMRKALLPTIGLVHLVMAAVFYAAFSFRPPATVARAALGITPTATLTPAAPPTDTPVSTATPVPTESPPPTATALPTGTPAPQPASPATPSPQPRITITKSAAPAEVLPGGQVVFTIRVCNEGDATAENVVVSDALPPELELVSASASQGTVVIEGNGVRAELGALEPGACAEITIVTRVRADVAPGTQIVNVASVGDTYDDASVTVTGLLPESGRALTLGVAAGLLIGGAVTLVAGLACKMRGRTH